MRIHLFIAHLFILTLTTAAQDTRQDNLALPTADQVVWQDYEIGTFFHLQPFANLDPAKITYENFDADAWAEAAVNLGAKYIVMVAKHGAGFCWWPTSTTDYSIQSTPYKNGKGDIVGEVFGACRARGLKVGFYCCPADNHYGANARRCSDDPKELVYHDYYFDQLNELCSNYSEMTEIWFDGSVCDDVLNERMHALIQEKQPQAMVFQSRNPTIRWVGNERGYAPYPGWNTTDNNSGKGKAEDGDPDGKYWLPLECDMSISSRWDGGPVRDLEYLMKSYYRTVGHGATLLLNYSPGQDGSIDPSYTTRGKEFGDEIKRRVGFPIAETSGNSAILELNLEAPSKIDHVIIMENIAYGERVREYNIQGMLANGTWTQLGSGTAIGHKRIHQIPATTVSRVRFTCTKYADGYPPKIRKLYVTMTESK